MCSQAALADMMDSALDLWSGSKVGDRRCCGDGLVSCERCLHIGQWNLRASVFRCPLQREVGNFFPAGLTGGEVRASRKLSVIRYCSRPLILPGIGAID